MSTTVKGFINASISGITFGLIPLFAIPVLNSGMHSTSVLIYRYAFGCLAMLGMLMFHRTRMWLAFGDFLRILLLSSMYAVSSIALIEGYNYMASGIATTLLFSYPVWTLLLSVVFLHERLSLTTTLAIGIAVIGVFFLSGILDGDGSMEGLTGLFLLLLSGFLYAVYMVIFPPNAHPPDAIAEANVLHLFLRDAHSHALRHLHTRSHRPNRYAQPAHQPLFTGLGANSHKQRYAYHGPKTDK